MGKRASGYIKLQGHTRNSSDISGVKDIRTISSSSAFMTNEERESLEPAMDFRALGIDTRREIDKFARQDAAVERFQKNYFKARERLAAKINTNRALMELRHELQRRRRMGEGPDPEGRNAKEAKPPVSQGGFNEVELRY
jgi:transcriptional regulator of aromatic amino acid metabolism